MNEHLITTPLEAIFSEEAVIGLMATGTRGLVALEIPVEELLSIAKEKKLFNWRLSR